MSDQQSAPTTSPEAEPIPVVDYEGSSYRTDFWDGQGREYEDAAEREALRRLLPLPGRRIAELGAGFGRLADLYAGYEQVILFDYSRTLLQDAVERWSKDKRFVFVAGNLYDLPLATAVLDVLVMVRVMHHLAEVSRALTQIRRTMHRQSVAVLEYANKRNLKALLRWGTRRQQWSPMALDPVEFVSLNFDFHPTWMRDRLQEAGLRRQKQLAVSHFRLPLLKQHIDADMLVGFERLFFSLAGRYPLSPSVFVQVDAPTAVVSKKISVEATGIAQLFRCPHCSTEPLVLAADDLVRCPACNRRYRRQKGIWNFKEWI